MTRADAALSQAGSHNFNRISELTVAQPQLAIDGGFTLRMPGRMVGQIVRHRPQCLALKHQAALLGITTPSHSATMAGR